MPSTLGVADLFGFFVLPAAVFAVVYFPILTRLSRGLVSPYAKADARTRLIAATIDGLLVVATVVLYWESDLVWYLAVGATYLLLRDGIKGQSIGKFLLGLVVINLETGLPSALAGSVRRNLLLLLPGAGVVAIFLEARTIVRDPQGQRLGDRLAQTHVVEGFGAKDLVRSFQDWLMSFWVRRAARWEAEAVLRWESTVDGDCPPREWLESARVYWAMKRRTARKPPTDPFETVRAVGLTLPDVEATTRYDGSPVLKLYGCFMAGLATHRFRGTGDDRGQG